MSYTRKAVIGLAWITIGTLLANLFSYLFRLVIAKNLPIEDYGLIYSVIAFFGTILIFSTLGMTSALAKFISEYSVRNQHKKIKEAVIWTAIMLFVSSALVSAICFLFADWLQAVHFHDPRASLFVKLYAFAFLLTPVQVLIRGVFKGKQRMDLLSLYQAGYSFILLALISILFYLGFGAIAAIYAYVLLPLLLAILFFPKVYTLIKSKSAARLDIHTAKKIFYFGLPFIVTGFSATLLTNADTLLLTYMSTLIDVGIYQAAMPTANILLLFGSIFSAVFLPMAAELWENKQKSLLSSAMKEIYIYVAVGFIPFVLAFIFYAKPILNILFGADYLPATNALRLLSVSAIFLIMTSIDSAFLSGIGKPKENAKAILIGTAINIIANILLIPFYGVMGAALATVVSSLVILGISVYYVEKYISVSVPLFSWFKTLVAGGMFIMCLWACQVYLDLYFLVKIPLSIGLSLGIYALFIYLFGVVTKKQILSLYSRIIGKAL